MKDVKIVQYKDEYAATVADMWNRSGENWGGENSVRTAESVKNEEEKSDNIRTFIALHNEEAVGYCSYSFYKEDEGASYISVLNVRTDCIGKKIGKKLVKECVEAAIHSDYPRLDLYTWQGNDKAVPLYKKCGFFWERRDGSTHLMNFIPYAMKTEAIKDYFSKFDWYADNKREIKIESDGREENGFEMYDYVWEKDGEKLELAFEKTGRGLTLIETDDYRVRAILKKPKVILKHSYEVEYEIVNKSKKPLDIEIMGLEDKNIVNKINFAGKVDDVEYVKGEFDVKETENVQEKGRTHPCVAANVIINGKLAVFKTGVFPEQPVKIEIANQKECKYLNINEMCYINIKNNTEDDTTIEFLLPNTEHVEFEKREIVVEVEKKSVSCIEVPCVVKDYGYYDEKIDMNIKSNTGDMQYSTRLKGAFIGFAGHFHGEDSKYVQIYNEDYLVKYNKKSNNFAFSKLGRGNNSKSVRMLTPKIGKPYSEEFANKEAQSIKVTSKKYSELIEIVLRPDKMSDVEITYFVELFSRGILNVYSEIKNISEDKVVDEVFVSYETLLFLRNAYIPYEGGILYSNNAEGLACGSWDDKKLSENWLFCGSNYNIGLAWDESTCMDFGSWRIGFEEHATKVKPQQTIRTKPVVWTLDTFDDYNKLREYLGYNEAICKFDLAEGFDINVNKSNPFIKEKCDLEFIENKQVMVEGSVNIKSKYGDVVSKERLEFKDNKALVTLDNELKTELDILDIDMDLVTRKISRQKAIFKKVENNVVAKKEIKQDKDVYLADNGTVSIMACPSISSGIVSMKYKGVEWLDNAFPEVRVKSWWNFWSGGITLVPEDMSFASIYKEEKNAEFVVIKDNYQNEWKGIKVTMDIKKQKELEGICIESYYMITSNAPVVAEFYTVKMSKNKFIKQQSFDIMAFLKEGEDLTKNWVKVKSNGENMAFRGAKVEYDVLYDDSYSFESDNQQHKLVRLMSDVSDNVIGITNDIVFDSKVMKYDLIKGSKITTKPMFNVFCEKDIDEEAFADLFNVKFDLDK